jgi:hypothetical protein
MNAAQSAAVWIADQIKGEGHIYASPTHNKFDHCIFERSTVGLRSSAGMDNTFDTCVFADPAAVAVVDVEAATRLRIRDCTFFGSRRSTGLRVGRGAVVVLSGVNRFNTLGRVSDIKPGAQVTMGQIQQSAIGEMQ